MKQQILYIEDDENLRTSTVFKLRRDGFEVDAGIDYEDAAELIAARKGRPYDLALLDFNFFDKYGGNLGGYHVAELVHKTWGGKVPCIVLSAQVRNLSPEHTQYFAAKYEKPISGNTLIDAVMNGIIASAQSPAPPARPEVSTKPSVQAASLDNVV